MFTKRRIATAVLTLATFIFAPTARPAADNGPDKKDADAAKSDATTKASSAKEKESSKDPNSAIEAELQQMKDLLNAQQQRITELETELHASRTGTDTPATAPVAAGSPTGSAAINVPTSPAITPMAAPQTGGTVLSGDQGKSPLSFKIGAADFTPGGWADFTGIFRSTDIGSGTGTTFASMPYNTGLPQAGLSELRLTAQTSRISLKVEAPISDSTHVMAYIESDFNGFQPPNAYLSTNSGTFRLRLYWADIRHDKWELMAGQSWSLLTPNRVGLSPLPADVFSTARLDTNYVAGLTYARQAGVRLVYHPTNWWAIGFALENPQQYVPSSVVFPGTGTYFSGQFDNGSGATNGGGAATNPAVPNLHPDVIVKSAFDWKVGDHALHVEADGLIRSFKDYDNLITPNTTSTVTGASAGLNANLELFPKFHLIFDSFYGAGGSRYIGALGPDVIVRPNGTLSAIHAGSGIGGFEYQVTPTFMFDGYYSGAYFARDFGLLASTATPAPTCEGVSGFTCVGYGFAGSANTNNRAIQEATFGFTKTFWANPNYGKLQFLSQSSYATRAPWYVASGAPKDAHAFIQYVDLRYVLP